MRYHFQGRLTAHDCKRHLAHPFTVPAGSGQVEIQFGFAPHKVLGVPNLLALTLFDSAGFRGAAHREAANFGVQIGAGQASPGFLPGPLPAGSWNVQVDTHMVMPGEPLRYWLDVTVAEGHVPDQQTTPSPAARSRLVRKAPGWYRGDLHSHSHHSDADGFGVADLLRAARAHGLDFLFLTDHNTTAGLAEMDAATIPDLLCCGGLELTTFWGHALCLGSREWVDWRIRPGSGAMPRIAAATYAQDQLFIIAHPLAVGEPDCTGCTWRYGEMMPGAARLVEIWNGPWGGDSRNELALALWYDWLNQGLRLVASAGTDTHAAEDYAAGPGLAVVYAEALSEAALLKALRAGKLYLSAGPQLGFSALDRLGRAWMIGDTVREPVTCTASWSGCPADAVLRVIVNGRLLTRVPAGGQGEHRWELAPHQADWAVVEIRRPDGEMLAISNPIFFGEGR